MSDIKEGDNVSWNWGNGHPEGTVAEVKTSGELAIETAGKHIKANASEENPAVHVARDGNDVIKRASALTKLDDDSSNGDDSADKNEEATDTKVHSAESNDEKPVEQASSNGTNGHTETTTEQAGDSADNMDISTVSTPGEEKVGEKRARDDDDIGDAPSPEEKEADDASGKEVKKAKLVEEDVENSAPDTTEEPQSTTKPTEDTPAAEETTPKKKAGRPKKSESQSKEANSEASGDGTESIARRTRSKA